VARGGSEWSRRGGAGCCWSRARTSAAKGSICGDGNDFFLVTLARDFGSKLGGCVPLLLFFLG
jgi:hypothetical protein